jgi:acidic type I keratin
MENQLGETEGRYSQQLCQLQAMVNNLESELGQVKTDIARQGQEYQTLLDIKTRLEMEIAEYRRLLDGEMT